MQNRITLATLRFLGLIFTISLFPPNARGQVPFLSHFDVELIASEPGGQFGGSIPDGNGGLLFSDFENNRINRVDFETGEVTIFDGNSGGANGLRFDASGGLVVMEGFAQRITRRLDGQVEVLADGFDGMSFNAPNDLVFDSQGGFYFTDPNFFAQVQTEGVYYMDQEGALSQIVSDLHFPNGIGLSPDEQTLYVSTPTENPLSDEGSVWAYDVMRPGEVANRKLFATGFVDGLDVDGFGNVFGSSWNGVRAWDDHGNLIWTMPGAGVWHVTIHDSSAGYPNSLYLSTFFGELFKVDLHPRKLGDVNEDGIVDLNDLDPLCAAIASASRRFNPDFEIDGNGEISFADVDVFLREYEINAGDTNIDDVTDFSDFLRLSHAFGTEGTWSSGDFDCNGRVEFSDFLQLSSNFELVAPQRIHVVPEPANSRILGAFLAFCHLVRCVKQRTTRSTSCGSSADETFAGCVLFWVAMKSERYAMMNLPATAFLFLLLTSAVVNSQELSIVVPNSLETTEGNIDYPPSFQDVTFPNGARGQIVYPSDQFGSIPDTHRFITGFRWRPDSSVSRPREVSIEHAEIVLSVTSRGPSDLSLNFEENYGPDRKVIYEGPLKWSTAAAGVPRDFDYITDFQEPFSYNPEDGNLLIDIIETGENLAFTVTDDHSNVYGLSFVASQAGPQAVAAEDFFPAPVTQFIFTVPEPTTSTLLVVCLIGFAMRPRVSR